MLITPAVTFTDIREESIYAALVGTNARLLRRALSSRVRSKPDFGTHVDDASRFVFRDSLLQSLYQGV